LHYLLKFLGKNVKGGLIITQFNVTKSLITLSKTIIHESMQTYQRGYTSNILLEKTISS